VHNARTNVQQLTIYLPDPMTSSLGLCMLQSVPGLLLLVTLTISPPALASAQQTTSNLPEAPSLQTDESLLQVLVDNFFAAYSKKDLELFLSLWSKKSPELESRKKSMPELFAEHEKLEVRNLQISKVNVEGDKATVGYEVEVTATEARKKSAGGFEKSSRILHSIKEDGKWKVWRDASLEEDLGWRLIEAKTDKERQTLLSTEKDLVTSKLTKALVTQARWELYQSNYPQALVVFRLAQAVADQIGDKEGIADVLLGFGSVDEAQGNFPKALENFHAAAAKYEEVGNKEYLAFVLEQIGSVYRRLGDYGLSLEYTQKSLAIAEANELTDVSLSTLMALGNTYYSLGDFDRALDAYEKVLPRFEALNRKKGISYALTNIGNIHYIQGDYAGALDRYQKSLAIEESIGDKSGLASSLANIGFVHRQQGNYEVALDFYQRSLNLREALGDKAGIANTLNYIANVRYRQGHYNDALQFFTKSLELKQSLGDKPGIVSSLYGIGQFHHSQGDYARAIDFYQKSLTHSEAMQSKHWITIELIALADSRCSQGNYETALEAADRAARLAREIGSPEMVWDARTVAGRAHRRLNRLTQAREAFDEAISTIEALRAQIAGSEQGRQLFFENKLAPYHEMVELLVTQDKKAEALSYAERAKARALVEVLSSGRVNITKAMTSQEQDQERRLQTELTSLNSQLSRERRRAQTDAIRISNLNLRLGKARLQYEAFQTGLYAVHPELRTRRAEGQIATASETAQLLPSDAALLEYLVTEERTYLFVVSKAKNAPGESAALSTYTLAIKRKDLAKEVAKFHHQLASRDISFRDSATKLFDWLLKPALADLRGKTALVISPDGELWELPFQSLVTTDRRYLLEDYAISYAPSATALREMLKLSKGRAEMTRRSQGLLAFGNATPERQVMERITAVHRDESLEPLPEAEREVKTIAQLYGGVQSKIYVKTDAREDRLKQEAGRFNVLHLATHGILNDASPMYSHLVLAQGPPSINEDGLLEAWEIMKLDLNADLVVLSACETGRGRVGAGEGMIGLAWAFFVAGTPTSVVSQWKVDSKSTTDLMIDFHRNLKAGLQNPAQKMRKAKALREAALKLLRTNEYRHPFYWAGFVVVGDPG
jgi:CHAT domain-containing protein/Tfp pilus assembly protein PilF